MSGYILETDACFGNFIDKEGADWALHGFINQPTCKVLGLYFDFEEQLKDIFML